MPRVMIVLAVALLAYGAPVGACESQKPSRSPSVQRQIEGRSWSVGGYTKREYKGRDSQGNRIGGTIEELPSGAFTFKGWSKRSPVAGRVQRFLDSRK